MARIRTIKPELLEDERTATLSHLEWRLFVSCLLLADDYGNFRAVASRVRGAALWAHADVDVSVPLARLGAVGLLRFYVVDGQRYAHVKGWDKHQRVDHKGKPACPPPPDEGPAGHPREDSRDPRETLAPDLDLNGSDLNGSEGIGREGDLGPARETGTTPALTPAPEPVAIDPRLWPAHRWRDAYGRAWREKYGVTLGGGESAARATGALADVLAGMPAAERMAAQAKATAMFAELLGDERPDPVARRHPWTFFVARFDEMRTARQAPRRGGAAAAATKAAIEAEAAQTDRKLAATRVAPERLPTKEQLEELRGKSRGIVAELADAKDGKQALG